MKFINRELHISLSPFTFQTFTTYAYADIDHFSFFRLLDKHVFHFVFDSVHWPFYRLGGRDTLAK